MAVEVLEAPLLAAAMDEEEADLLWLSHGVNLLILKLRILAGVLISL